MQQALHQHFDLLSGLNAAFDALLADRPAEAQRALHATVANLPWEDERRDQVAELLSTALTCNSHDGVTTLLLDIHALVEQVSSGQRPPRKAV